MKVDWVPLRRVLRQRTGQKVEQSALYPIAGVAGFGRGVILREALLGRETSYRTLTRLTSGDVVYSKLKAFEGAIAVVPDQAANYFVSPEFPVFEVEPSVNTAYLEQFLHSSIFGRQLALASKGLGARRERVHPSAFECLQLPLPSPADQTRIANYLNNLAKRTIDPGRLQAGSAISHAIGTWLEEFPQEPLTRFAEVAPKTTRLADDELVDFVPMEAVDATAGMIVASRPLHRAELGSGYRQFKPGDIIFARITPSMQNGKCAIYGGVRAQVGYGSTEFHVLRPHDARYTKWLWAVLRTDWFISQAKRSFTGTAGQQRVPASFLHQVRIPVPPTTELVEATDRLVGIRERLNQIQRTHKARNALAGSILPAARNEIFNSMQ